MLKDHICMDHQYGKRNRSLQTSERTQQKNLLHTCVYLKKANCISCGLRKVQHLQEFEVNFTEMHDMLYRYCISTIQGI
jgi:hypothetical protein